MLQRDCEGRNFRRVHIAAKGNCTLGVVALKVYGNQDKAPLVRKELMQHVLANKTRFLDLVKTHYNGTGGQRSFESVEAYVEHMERNLVWADEFEMAIALERYPQLTHAVAPVSVP